MKWLDLCAHDLYRQLPYGFNTLAERLACGVVFAWSGRAQSMGGSTTSGPSATAVTLFWGDPSMTRSE